MIIKAKDLNYKEKSRELCQMELTIIYFSFNEFIDLILTIVRYYFTYQSLKLELFYPS